jgi:hypothetical protein
MKDPYILLHQKEADLARIRREIDALLTVIPLLADPPSYSALAYASAAVPEHPSKDLAELEVYYPFLRRSR